MSKKAKTIIVIGHSSEARGAVSSSGDNLSEWEYNRRVGEEVARQAREMGYDVEVMYRHGHDLSGLVERINEKHTDAIISLHCNAFNERATGSEVLHAGSRAGEKLATIVLGEVQSVLGLANRGVKYVSRGGRGGKMLHATNAPCVIIEPFFIDNPSDEAVGLERKHEYARAIVRAITQFINS